MNFSIFLLLTQSFFVYYINWNSRALNFTVQIMHEIMVKPLPPDCYFQRENIQQCDITWIHGHFDNVSVLAVMPLWDYIFFNTCGLLTMTYNIQDLPQIVYQLLCRPLRFVLHTLHSILSIARMELSKKFRHPYRLEVLRQKESKAVAVSAVFSSESLLQVIFL